MALFTTIRSMAALLLESMCFIDYNTLGLEPHPVQSIFVDKH